MQLNEQVRLVKVTQTFMARVFKIEKCRQFARYAPNALTYFKPINLLYQIGRWSVTESRCRSLSFGSVRMAPRSGVFDLTGAALAGLSGQSKRLLPVDIRYR